MASIGAIPVSKIVDIFAVSRVSLQATARDGKAQGGPATMWRWLARRAVAGQGCRKSPPAVPIGCRYHHTFW